MTSLTRTLAPLSIAIAASLTLVTASTTALAKPAKPAASSTAAAAPSAPPAAAAPTTPPARTAAPAPTSTGSSKSSPTTSSSSDGGGSGGIVFGVVALAVAGIGALIMKKRGTTQATAPTGDSVAIKTTVIEKQPADAASFPVRDSVLKGTVVVTAQSSCVLASTRYEIRLELDTPNGPVDELVASNQTPAPAKAFSASFGGTNIEFPLKMYRGKSATQTWLVSGVDIPAKLAAHGFDDPSAAANDPRVKLVVACYADVQDAPTAAATRTVVQMTA